MFVLILVCLFFEGIPVVKAFEIGLLYGRSYPAAQVSQDSYFKYDWGTAGSVMGLQLTYLILPKIFLTTGVMEAARGFSKKGWSSWQVPLIGSLSVSRWMRVGFGAYYSYSQKLPQAIQGKYLSYDYGFLGSLGFSLPLMPFIRLSLEGRYLFGLPNLRTGAGGSSNHQTVYGRDIQLLGGVAFGI